jgi:cytochrome c peroxidase
MLPKLQLIPSDPNAMPSCSPESFAVEGEPTAVAWDGNGRVVVQSREPAQIQVIGGPTVRLSDDSRADTGLALFHMNAQNSISCSSCHAEGGEDARVWQFAGIGARRTQSLAGGAMGRAPFHWDGELEDFSALVHEVFVSRMSGPRPNQAQIAHFADWLDTIAAPATATVDADAAQRGLALFNDPGVGCADCHSGPDLTNNESHDVGTGQAFQVPSLVGIGARAPFLHDGCAPTLRDRFGACGGGDLHGKTSHLSPAQIDDLVAYLESL